MASDRVNQLNFVNFDFDDLVAQLSDRVKLRDAWKDTYRSSTGQMLIELHAYVANLILYYIERRAEESYLGTAKNRSSILNLVRLINFKPKRKTSAKGKLEFSVATPAPKKIFVPKYTECRSVDGFKYLTNEEVVLNVGQIEVEADSIQGELIETEVSSIGGIAQEYKVEDSSVENENVFVYVNDVAWTKVDAFLTSTNLDEHYQIRHEIDDKITIIFGDNVFGRAPSVGDTIKIRYVKSDGLQGNVFELDRVTTLSDSLFDEDGDPVSVSVTNSDFFLGGDDSESNEEIRNEAPRVFATGDRAVTRSDFIALIENFAGVANANVWGENEESPPNFSMFNRIKLVVLLQNFAFPSATFETELTDFLFTKSMITVRYSFVNAVILEVIPTMDVKVLAGKSLSQVQSDIEDAVGLQFVLGETTRIGQHKRHSDIIDIVEEVPGVSYSHIVLEIRKNMGPVFEGFEWGGTLDALQVKKNSVRVYVDGVAIAKDDGSGFWLPIGVPAITTTGDINYVNGKVHLNFAPDVLVTSIVTVRYQQDENGDIVLLKEQICRLDSVEVTDIAYE